MWYSAVECIVPLLLSLLVVPHTLEAQQAEKVYRIGVLEMRSAALNAAHFEAFRQGLRALGYTERQNLEIVYRSSDGRDERFPDLASELMRLQVDLILTRGTPATLAAKNATRTIPIVMASVGAPVGAGLVASLGRPGGNVTGLSGYNVEMFTKRVELLRALLPGLTRIAGLFNMGNPVSRSQWQEVEQAAQASGWRLSCSTCDAPRSCRTPSRRQRRRMPRPSS
jgi:putative ABC transport system substrate-binding protein